MRQSRDCIESNAHSQLDGDRIARLHESFMKRHRPEKLTVRIPADAYESQVPEVATTKVDGLKKFYGVTQPEGLAYFEIHEEADKAHRAAWRGWLEEHAEGNEEEILKTANEALDALWGALDAVHCEKQEVRM